jgi:glycosyltransferase involved in cell wall biosynthesis
VKNNINMGAGYSRKVGIEHATGDYIITIDADDWIEPQFL